MERATNDVAGVPRARRADETEPALPAPAGAELSSVTDLSNQDVLSTENALSDRVPVSEVDGAADVDDTADVVGVTDVDGAADVDGTADVVGVAEAVDTGGRSDRTGRTDRTDRLTDRERDVLDFEKAWWRHAGAKEQAIRDRFELSATRYYQLLNALLERPAALAHDPILVTRLRRLRAHRRRTR